MEMVLAGLKAAAEPTRLRILLALAETELTVGELCEVLGQSQPRVSRHLKLLCDAGLLERHAQGTSAYYRPPIGGSGRQLLDAVRGLVDADDHVLRRDRQRLDDIRGRRAEAAAAYFESIAGDWDRLRDLHVADAEVEAALLAAVGQRRVRNLLDVGTGTGRMLELFAPSIEQGLGIDLSRQMLNLARSRLDERGLKHCSVRHANIYDLDVEAGSFDIAVLHHVLHFLDHPAMAIAEAARTLRPGALLLVVDFAPHDHRQLQTEYAHHWLGFDDAEVEAWCSECGLGEFTAAHMTPTDQQRDELLTVTLWTAVQRADAPAVYDLEAAS